MIYGFLFGAGKIIFGQVLMGIGFIVAGLIFGAIIYADLSKRGWESIVK